MIDDLLSLSYDTGMCRASILLWMLWKILFTFDLGGGF